VIIECDSTDGSLLMATMIISRMGILAAARPGFAFGGRDEFFGIAERNTLTKRKLFRTLGDEHHVRTFFQDGARGLNGIFDATKTGDGTRAKRGSVHDNGVAFDIAIEIEMRAVARVEHGIVFEHGDGGFDGVESVAAVAEYGIARVKRAKAAGVAGFDGVVWDVPGTAVDDERRAHEKRE